MKLRTFITLLILCCLLSVTVLFIFHQKNPDGKQTIMGTQLFPLLSVGDIAAVTINSPDGTVTLKQGERVWTVENRFGHPADFSKISDLVKKFTSAKIGRTFEVTADIEARLALRPPDQKDLPNDQKGTRIVLMNKDSKALADLIIGKHRDSGAGAVTGTFYAKRPLEPLVYVIDQDFRLLDKKPADWLAKSPIDLNPKRIEKVVCFDTQKNTVIYTLKRPAKDKDPVLSDLPPGGKMAKFKADQVFEALTSLTVEDVAAPGPDTAARFSDVPRFDYHLYDGTIYHVFPGPALKDDPENHYFRATVSYAPPHGIVDPDQKENQAKLAGEADKLNLKISPWTYIISKWVFDGFFTDPQNLIEKEEKK